MGFDVVLLAPHTADVVDELVQIQALRPSRGRWGRLLQAREIYRAARCEDATLYHAHDPELLPVLQLLRRSGKHVVFDMHENLPKAVLTKNWIPSLCRRAAARCVRTVERRLLSDLPIVFAEESYRRDYAWAQKTCVVLNMPVLEAFPSAHAQSNSPTTLAYMGNLAVERGSLVMLEAVRLLKSGGLDLQFECLGRSEDSHRAELLAFQERHGLSGVRLRGQLPPRECWKIMAECHIGLAVLKPDPNYVESYPTKMFEYMALGMPVVVSNFPLYRRIVESVACGICVDPLDPHAVAQAVRWLVEHPTEAKAMGARGRRAVEAKYNWSNEAEKLANFYNELLHAGPGEMPDKGAEWKNAGKVVRNAA
jgi:glycosyltransferase involved in cell wall biosynthesis